MNILVEPGTGRLTGVVDWADSNTQPFGLALWGLESILGRHFSSGWSWLSDQLPTQRKLFMDTFELEVGGISERQRQLIENARLLGILLRYGFTWVEDRLVATEQNEFLETLLRSD